jgi:hypothetical protein
MPLLLLPLSAHHSVGLNRPVLVRESLAFGGMPSGGTKDVYGSPASRFRWQCMSRLAGREGLFLKSASVPVIKAADPRRSYGLWANQKNGIDAGLITRQAGDFIASPVL